MASLTVSSSLAGMKLTSKPTAAQQHRAVKVPVKASLNASIEVEKEKKEAMHRRSLMFAAAAAAVSAVSQGKDMKAMAAEPRNGSPEAKKIYARICATMPTAKVCHY